MVSAQTSNVTRNVKILLVEDNDISRQLMTDFLIDFGYDVLSLDKATSFASVMEHFQPNIILLDLKLPEIDGFTLLQQLRQKPEWRQVPTIVVSAFAFHADRQRALELGARRYLVKPVKLMELIEALQAETKF
ncbi:response regulator with CheY-like receiver domain and winged-helix DNA-binding domain [Leptolyngbyaceae cyanobacterium JSC-12]|nr:response regulator with CheY-like receiver domain and winged-helix DNA-binding domain [Leptolyngbyaceae cyanobacterium JSC-12]